MIRILLVEDEPGFAQNVARDIVERAYERRRDEVRGERPAERDESVTQGDSVPRARPLRREE